MNGSPSLPGWDGIHPVMVQFAVVLLLVAPLLLLASLFARRTWRAWAAAALVLMALGSVSAWLAVGSGHAAGQLVDKTGAVAQAVQRHEALGVQTRDLFTILTLAFAVLWVVPVRFWKSAPAPARIAAHAVLLVVWLGSTVLIARTASQGGRLVHELGVRATIAGPSLPAR